MKKTIVSLTILLASSVLVAEKVAVKASDLGADVKAGYFNSAQVIGESKAGKDAYAAIEGQRNEYATSFQKLEEEYTKKVKDLQAKQSTLSVAAKEKAQVELMEMKQKIENEAKNYEEKLKLAMQQAQDRLFRDLSDSVYECGRKEDKDVMIDVMSGRVYVINPDKVNSTKSIIASMDARHVNNKVAAPAA